MSFKKPPKLKLRYKKILKVKQNIQNRSKFINFKAKKWQNIILKTKKTFKYNCKLKNIDQFNYFIPKFTDFFSNRFKLNLNSKQKLNYLYGCLARKYLKSLIDRKTINKKYATYFLLKILEKRLDSVLYRSHFVKSFRDARQLISHGHVFVNGVSIKTQSLSLVEGDVISISKKMHPLIEKNIKESSLLPLPPKYLQINYKIFFIVYLSKIKKSNLFNQFNFWLDLKTVIDFHKYC